ncbi:MAG: CopD family protein [Paracoccaceae bacterium]|nr:CopD family protein [Paracoccaceae bacterium]
MPDVWQLAAVATSVLVYFGVLGAFGLVLVRIVFRDETRRARTPMARQAIGLSLLALLASGAGFVLTGAIMTGDASGMIDREMLGLVWGTTAGTALVLQITGLVLVIVGLCVPGVGDVVAAIGGTLALWSFSQMGHIAAIGSLWPKGLLLLHLAGAAFWVGILFPLWRLSGDREALSHAADLGHRFGQVAAVTVPVQIAAGIVLAWILVETPSALLSTGYGLTLLAKIGIVACLLVAAAANKLRFVPAMRRGDWQAAIRLRRSMAVEWVAFSLILLATAVLTTTSGPPSGVDP